MKQDHRERIIRNYIKERNWQKIIKLFIQREKEGNKCHEMNGNKKRIEFSDKYMQSTDIVCYSNASGKFYCFYFYLSFFPFIFKAIHVTTNSPFGLIYPIMQSHAEWLKMVENGCRMYSP